MGIFNLFKGKMKSVLGKMMEIPELKARKQVFDAMSARNAIDGYITDEIPFSGEVEVSYNHQRSYSLNGYEAPLVYEAMQKIA